jgi:alkanesulfonate monooxygenase SsuD/methylene tetrahydromethanopterin reductase-like flavin-dependent oxidoreductase (luciferase family)
MRFGFAIPAYGQHADGPRIRALLVAADELGFDSAWFPDHIAVPEYASDMLPTPVLEPLAACAWGLGFTSRLHFGTDVLVAPYRHPLLVAAVSGTLGRLTGDRFILGVGIGYLRGEFEILGAAPYEDRAEVTEAFLKAQRSTPEGYSVVSSTSPPPLWVGGNTLAAERRAALLGDGWHPLWMPDRAYAAARRRILAARADASLTTAFTFSYSCSHTELLLQSRDHWPAPRVRAPKESEFRYAPEDWNAEDGRPRFVGTPDQVVSDLQLLEGAGVQHVTLRFGSTDVEPLERFAREVRPAFAAGADV